MSSTAYTVDEFVMEGDTLTPIRLTLCMMQSVRMFACVKLICRFPWETALSFLSWIKLLLDVQSLNYNFSHKRMPSGRGSFVRKARKLIGDPSVLASVPKNKERKNVLVVGSSTINNHVKYVKMFRKAMSLFLDCILWLQLVTWLAASSLLKIICISVLMVLIIQRSFFVILPILNHVKRLEPLTQKTYYP